MDSPLDINADPADDTGMSTVYLSRVAVVRRLLQEARSAGEVWESIALRLGVSVRTVQSWAAGSTAPPQTRIKRVLEELEGRSS